jgi:multiple sugar transport system permease protein
MAVKAQPARVDKGVFSRQIVPRISGGEFLAYAVLTVGCLAMLLPFAWMVLSAFKPRNEVLAYPPALFPQQPTLELLNYVWTQIDFSRLFYNSLVVTTISTAFQIFTSLLTGFVFAKYQFWGRNALFIGLLATMMIPWPVLLIPQYMVAVNLRLINSHWALILPAMYSAFGIFLMRQFLHSIPDELLDAGRIDGANEIVILFRIVTPLTGPALAALAIFFFLGQWDSFVWPLIVLNDEKLFTLPIGLATFAGKFWTDTSAVNAGTFIATIPVLIVFFIFQRRFIEGITLTGLRG